MTDHARYVALDEASEDLLAAVERGLREDIVAACRRTAGGRRAEVRLVVVLQNARPVEAYFTEPAPGPKRYRNLRRRQGA